MKPSSSINQTINLDEIRQAVLAELQLCKLGATTTNGIEQQKWLARWDAVLSAARDPFATAEPCWKGGR